MQFVNFEKVEKVVQHVFDRATKGDAQSVIDAIDELPAPLVVMHVGDKKARAMERLIKIAKPKVLVELGGYFGYSAIRLAFAALKHNPKAHYYSIELSPVLTCVIETLAKFAGLSGAITVLPGNLAKNTTILKEKLLAGSNNSKIDFLLLDHWKEDYVPDLRLAHAQNFFKPGTVIVADNIYYPGAPEYQKYMEDEDTLYTSKLIPFDNDAMLVSTVNE